MIGFILSPLFFAIAAIFNSLMDTVADRPHFERSIFSNKNPEFWIKTESWDNKYNDIDGDGEGDVEAGLRYKGWLGWMNNFSDVWHIAKMGMIFSFAFSVLFFPLAFNFNSFENNFWNGFLLLVSWFGIFGVCWNAPFNLFYQKIFVRNK